MTEDQINALTFAALREYRPEGFLFGELQVSWGASSRAIGSAMYPGLGQVKARPSIRYSRPLMAALDDAEQRDTVIHEVAHLLVADDWARRSKERVQEGREPTKCPPAHGLEWQVWMIKMGGKPRASCNDEKVAAVGLAMIEEKRKQRPEWIAGRCSCVGRTWPMALNQAARGPSCRKCRKPIVFPRAENLAIVVHLAARGRPLPSTPDWLIEKAKGLAAWTKTSSGRGKIVALARELAGSLEPAA